MESLINALDAQPKFPTQIHEEMSSPLRTPGSKPLQIAVLGAGLSGLSVAFHLSRSLRASSGSRGPAASIVLVEASGRVGGWARSLRDGDFLFEEGPRTLRPQGAGRATLDLVRSPRREVPDGYETARKIEPGIASDKLTPIMQVKELALQDKVVRVPKSSPAAKSRFLYLNDSLHELPRSFLSLIKPSVVTDGMLATILREPFVPPTSLPDESIDAFITRRFSAKVAQNLVSAVVRGIYAGDSRELSVRSCFPSLWLAEQKHGSVLKGMAYDSLFGKSPDRNSDDEFIDSFKTTSVYSFTEGLQTLSDSLLERLKTYGVEIRFNTQCKKLTFDPFPKVRVRVPLPALHVWLAANT